MLLDKDNKYTNLENYNIKIKEDCFFGSKGVNTGTFFIKKEEFSLFLPKYETDFEYRHYNTKGKMKVSTKGEFEEALIDNSKLNLDTYVNKYNCFLYGGNCENVIINKKSENNKKLLLISSSYGRAFAPYISQCFYETRYIDPQQGRFEQNVINYIDNYKPDIVVMLYKGTTNIDFI